TALLALVAGAEGDRIRDASDPPATVQHCNDQAENGPIRVQTEASGTVAAGVAGATPTATVLPGDTNCCSAPAPAAVPATPESGPIRTRNGPLEGQPLQCCTVADPYEVSRIVAPERASVAELAETLLADLARAGWPWPDDGGGACGPDSPDDAI